MDSIDQLLHLRQAGLSIEEYVHQFWELSYQVPLYDEFLFKDLFYFGLNEHIKSQFDKSLFSGGEFNGSLRGLMDFALLYAGSSFTVGVAGSAPEPAPSQELAESAPEPAPSQELAESAPEPAPSQELAESAPEPAPSQELAESAPEPAPSQELAESAPCQERAESAPEAAPCQERAESAPEAAPCQERAESAPSQELAEFALQSVPPSSPSSPLVPSSSPSSPLVPSSSPSSPLVPPSSPSPLVLSSLALSERPRDPAPPECPLTFAPPECPLEVVELPRDFLGGSFPPLLTEAPEPAMAHGVP